MKKKCLTCGEQGDDIAEVGAYAYCTQHVDAALHLKARLGIQRARVRTENARKKKSE